MNGGCPHMFVEKYVTTATGDTVGYKRGLGEFEGFLGGVETRGG